MSDPRDRPSADDMVEVPVDVYEGDDTYIVYDEDGNQDCFTYGDE